MSRIFLVHIDTDEALANGLAQELSLMNYEVVSSSTNKFFTSDVDRDVNRIEFGGFDILIPLITANFSSGKIPNQATVTKVLSYLHSMGKPVVLPILVDNAIMPEYLGDAAGIEGSSTNVNAIASAIAAHIKAEKKESRQQLVQSNAETYISVALKRLQSREKHFFWIANILFFAAAVSLALAITFAVLKMLEPIPANLGWPTLILIILQSVIIVTLLGAFSRFAFVLGKSYMVESLRNAERGHAISFGDFYVKAYPDNLEWKEVKEALQHWNIDKGSAFHSQSAKDFDPEILATAIKIAELLIQKKDK